MPKTKVAVDVSNLAYRSSFAHKTLTTQDGRFSGHVFGAVSSLLSFAKKFPEGVDFIFCYDGSTSKKERQKILPEYKAHRIPHEINPLPEVSAIIRMIPGVHILQDDMEGDDAIAFAVTKIPGEVVVLSADKDLWGLITGVKVSVYSPNLGRYVVLSDIIEEFHVNDPNRVYLAKALFGDPSDGIKGIERLTKKQVEPILAAQNVTDVESFYGKLGSTKPEFISDKNWDKLLSSKDKVLTNYKVITPKLNFKKESLMVYKGGIEPLLSALESYECISLLDGVKDIFGKVL